MVVLLILAILLAIAIPTFLGVTGGANDRAAQSNLNTALTTAKAAESQNTNQVYTGITPASLHSNEPSISFVTGAVAAAGVVSVYVSSDGNGIVLAAWSPANSATAGTCRTTRRSWLTLAVRTPRLAPALRRWWLEPRMAVRHWCQQGELHGQRGPSRSRHVGHRLLAGLSRLAVNERVLIAF